MTQTTSTNILIAQMQLLTNPANRYESKEAASYKNQKPTLPKKRINILKNRSKHEAYELFH